MKHFTQIYFFKMGTTAKLLNDMFKISFFSMTLLTISNAQNFSPVDPYNLLIYERGQFEGKYSLHSNIFRPIFFRTDSISYSLKIKSESYFNDNAPNQENMDVRYFSKGIARFSSLQLAFNSPYFSMIAEPYLISNKFLPADGINRGGAFEVLNDRPLNKNQRRRSGVFRNLLAVFHYKGFGFGWHEGNRWWGPGIHSSMQMTNNAFPFPAQILGTIQEVRIGSFGFYGLYTFAKINKNKSQALKKYFTSINAQVSWYGPIIISTGFSRNYLTGGELSNGYKWTEKDARNIIFEGIFISNVAEEDFKVGGHDIWDQTLSGYISIIMPKRNLKVYSEIAFNDNRMYFADFLSQPDHSMATIFGLRDYGIGKYKNWIWGFEWTNLMITYSSRHRIIGPGTWYSKELYNYSSYYGRRWGAHSGTDSDDWYLYLGYLSDKLLLVPALNYERHGIVSYRPAEVKLEFRLDLRYNYKDIWFGLYLEKQFEAFLGFPNYFYVNNQGEPSGYEDRDRLAKTRKTNTIIFSLSKTLNF
jgi:hypothetical protein